MAYTVYIRGIPGNAQVTEVRVHVTPGLNTDVPFKVPLNATATCTAVQADPANDAYQGQVYKWFNLTFPDGRTGWVRDDLLDLQGDCSSFGYGNYDTRTFAFSALAAVAAAAQAQTVAAAPAQTTTIAQTPASPAPAPATPAVTVTVSVSQPTTIAPVNCVATVRNDTKAKVRAQPSVNATVLGGMNPGQQTPVQDVVPGQDGQSFRWIQTTFNGGTGYIREDLLTYSPDCVTAFGVGTTQPAGGVPAAAQTAAATNPGQIPLFSAPLRMQYVVYQKFGDTMFGPAHKGTDLNGPGVYGAPLYASGNGFVHYTMTCTRCTPDKPSAADQGLGLWNNSVIHDPAWGYGFGNHVVLRFPWSVLPDPLRQEMSRQNVAGGYAYVYYAHLQQIQVTNGQAVTPDTVVGLLGNTGNSSGYHVHIELHVSMYADEHDVFSRLNLDPKLMYQLGY